MILAELLERIKEGKQYRLGGIHYPNLIDIVRINRQMFVYEYYLLQLSECKASSADENQIILDATTEVKNYLSELYSYVGRINHDHQFDITSLKKIHTECGRRELMAAAESNDNELLEASMATGADVNFKYCDDYAIVYAIKNNNYYMLKQLISAGANVNIISGTYGICKETPLTAAVAINNIDMVKLLIENGANVNTNVRDKGTALYNSCHPSVSFEITEYLSKLPNIDINAKLQGHVNADNALCAALVSIQYTHDSMKAKCLLSSDKFQKNSIDLSFAITQGIEAVTVLVEAGYMCTAEDLEEAIKRGDAKVIDMLVKQASTDIDGAKLNLVTNDGYTDLMFYVSIGDVETVKSLLAGSKDNINDQNADYKSALMIAVDLGRTEIASLLIKAGADVNFQTEYGYTPLMSAASAGYTDIVKLLLEHNAQINTKASIVHPKNITALYLATANGHADIVEELLNKQTIDTTIKTECVRESDNKTANELGLESKNPRIVTAYQVKNAKASVIDLESELNKEIQRFRENGKAFFGIGNNKKADKIQNALKRAEQNRVAQVSMADFLKYKENGKESILDALSYHRIGFFGKPTSMVKIQTYVDKYKFRTR